MPVNGFSAKRSRKNFRISVIHMISTATRQMLTSFDKVDHKTRYENIYLGALPNFSESQPVTAFPTSWQILDMDGSFNAHWKKLDANQKASLYRRYEIMVKPDGVKERRVILRTEMERFGYKPPSIQLSIRPIPEPAQPQVPRIAPITVDKTRDRSQELAPLRKESQKEPRENKESKESREPKETKQLKEPKEPKQPSPLKITERAPSVSTGEEELNRIQRTIYEVVNIRLEKPSKDVILQVRYGPTPDQMEWISASGILDPESLAALQKAMIKVR